MNLIQLIAPALHRNLIRRFAQNVMCTCNPACIPANLAELPSSGSTSINAIAASANPPCKKVNCTCNPCCKPESGEADSKACPPASAPCPPPPCPPPPCPPPDGDVPGLSDSCFCEREPPLGPGAGKCCDYKAPEYYSYHRYTFAESMVEMDCLRLPQPDAKMKR